MKLSDRTPRSAAATAASNRATACRDAHAEIDRFIDWTRRVDIHQALEWRTRASRLIRDGASAAEAVATIKREYLERCRAAAIRPTVDPTPADLQRRLAEVLNAAHAGARPFEAAAMYRQIARDFPDHAAWLAPVALLWDSWGEHWQRWPNKVPAAPPRSDLALGGS